MAWTQNGKMCNKEVYVADYYSPSNIYSSELHNGFCCIYDNYLVFFSTQVEWLKLNGNNRAQMSFSVVVDGMTYYYINVSGTYTPNNDVFVKPAIFDFSIVADDIRYMISASGLVAYTIYWEYSGAQNTMEWRNATPGGVIFAFHRAQNDTYAFVLAYDLRSISNPEVGYMYMRRNDGGSSYVISTVYRYTDDDVYTVSTNLTFANSDSPSGWDVLIEGAHADYEYPSVIRAYWDAQGGVENLYVGVNGKAQQVKALYVGVNGTAREVKAIYVGVNGKAREVFKST